MKSSTRDKAEGKWHKVKGKIKQVAGKQSGIAIWKPKAKPKMLTGRFRKRSAR